MREGLDDAELDWLKGDESDLNGGPNQVVPLLAEDRTSSSSAFFVLFGSRAGNDIIRLRNRTRDFAEGFRPSFGFAAGHCLQGARENHCLAGDRRIRRIGDLKFSTSSVSARSFRPPDSVLRRKTTRRRQR